MRERTFAASGSTKNPKGVTVRQTFTSITSAIPAVLRSIAAATLAMMVVLQPHQAQANSRSAAIVVDAKTGKILYSESSESRRYPASLTKMMTLYITFEALASGKITKQTRIPFSAQAAAKPPTKLGVKAGGSITVETAIYALVTKSANDAASALGEYFGGSEAGFARMMTAKARRLGMNGTVYRNPSGLPDPGQFTTAHDQARLGLALRRDFPQYYKYFSTRSFTYGRQRMANHNRLLGRVKGVDGIKTGYTRMSGFNLVSSVSDGNRRIVAVVMGGTSGGSRDKRMAALIKQYLPKASTKGAPLLARAEGKTNLADIILPKSGADQQVAEDTGPDEEAVAEVVAEAPKQKQLATAKAAGRKALAEEKKQAVAEAKRPKVDVDEVKTASVAPSSGWAVQIASSPSKAEAAAALVSAAQKGKGILTASAGFTTTFEKGGTTYYRARFGGFANKTAAWKACTSLKSKKIACYAVEN